MDSSTGDTFPLIRSDEYAANQFSPSWNQSPALPNEYSVSVTPPASFALIPAPSNSGTLDLCTTNSGPSLTLDGSAVELGVPNDLTVFVKWGTLEQLLSADGDVRGQGSTLRAKYCSDLYNLGVSLGRNPVTTLLVSVGDVPIPVGSIDDLDRYSPDWQNTSAQPSMAALVGANLIALSAVPDAVYSITSDMASAFPIPDTSNPSSTYLQVGAELVNAILDMAQHICAFKMEWFELQSTIPLRTNFLRTCSVINSRLRSNAFFNLLLDQPASRQDYQYPRTMPRSPEKEEIPA